MSVAIFPETRKIAKTQRTDGFRTDRRKLKLVPLCKATFHVTAIGAIPDVYAK
jgi:hypothetical protein